MSAFSMSLHVGTIPHILVVNDYADTVSNDYMDTQFQNVFKLNFLFFYHKFYIYFSNKKMTVSVDVDYADTRI